VAGYAWPWISNPDRNKNPAAYDIELDNYRMKWNSVAQDWVNSPNALNEVGCIHTIQGYGLNYVGVVIGPEVKFNPKTDQLEIDSDHYYDKNGYTGIDENELRYCILNIYKTLLTRGISGTYVYIVDEHLRNRFKAVFDENAAAKMGGPILSPLNVSTVSIPVVGSAPCGNPLLGEENREGYIEVDKTKIKPGFKYFVLRAEGDSMNKAGILDGDLVLCRQQLKADTGDKVVALLGDNVTIKEYGPRVNGVRSLIPRSSNQTHQPITPNDGDSVQGVVQEVLPVK
jgi:SOS-response transcriptional repressor LexA